MKFKGLHGLEMRHGGALIGWWPLCRVHSQGVPVQCTAISKVEERLEPLHQQPQYFRLISNPGNNLPEPELELQILRDPQEGNFLLMAAQACKAARLSADRGIPQSHSSDPPARNSSSVAIRVVPAPEHPFSMAHGMAWHDVLWLNGARRGSSST
jgi:hypothetical protein